MTTLTKKTIRRNLPLNDIYQLIDSYYTGTENGTCCQNCNKYITNVAVIQNQQKQRFEVGLDCAETLRNLEGLGEAIRDFKEAKAIRAKANKALKEGKEIKVTCTIYGQINITANALNIALTGKEFAKKFLPDYYAKVSNSEKLDYIPFTAELIPEGTNKESLPMTVQYQDFKISILYGDKTSTNWHGVEVTNKMYLINISHNNEQLEQRSTYMPRSINSEIQYGINRYSFDNI